MQAYMQHQVLLQRANEAAVGAKVSAHHSHMAELARQQAEEDRAELQQAQVALQEASQQQQRLVEEVQEMQKNEEGMKEEHARWRLMAERREEVTATEMAKQRGEMQAAKAAAAFGANAEEEGLEDEEDSGPHVRIRSELHAANVLRGEAHGELMQAQVIRDGNGVSS